MNFRNFSTEKQSSTQQQMEIAVKGFNGREHVIDVGCDDTVGHIRRRIAAEADVREDAFYIIFQGGQLTDDAAHVTQLCAGDTLQLLETDTFKAVAALQAKGVTCIDETGLHAASRDGAAALACLYMQALGVTATPVKFLAGTALVDQPWDPTYP